MAYDYDPYYDDPYGGSQQPPNFWNQTGPPSIVPNTAPTIDFQGTTQVATGQPGVYTPQTTGGATGGYSGPNDFRGIVQWWQGQHPASAPDMSGLIAFLNSKGIQAATAPHAGGLPSDDKIIVNGQMYDLGSSLGGPDGRWFSDFAPMGNGGDQGYAIDPSFLAPYTEQFAAPGDAALPQFQSPGAFKMPTADDMLKNPGYLWEEGRIRDSVENSASAAGTLNSSGTLDRIMGSVSDFARTNWNNLVNQQYGIWNSDWNHSLDEYGAKTGRATSAYQRAMQEFDQRKNQFFQNQDRPYDKLIGGGSLGARALD